MTAAVVGPARRRSAFAGLVCLLVFAACAPRVEPPGVDVRAPTLGTDAVIAADGASLPLRRWTPPVADRGVVVLAVHGFNDYGNFFADAGAFFSQRGVPVYAYDQRGFGGAPNRGIWAGTDAYAADLSAVSRLVRAAHPKDRLIIVGESMGGAFAMTASARGTLDADGLILAAPAVWGRAAMPWYQQAALWLSAHTVPWLSVSGRSLNRRPSDNIEMLRAMGRDPLVIKETRIDSVYGLVDAMDAAMDAAGALRHPAMMLYGKRDEIVPETPSLTAARAMTAAAPDRTRVAVYASGFHMLLRDLQAETVWRDMLAWMMDPDAPLPSGADTAGAVFLQGEAARAKAAANGSTD
jgi:acylglycerol lipase